MTRTAQSAATAAGGPRTTTTVDGQRIAYETYGDPDGRPLVFLHGTPGSRLSGRLFADRAREAGVRVVAPDRPGYGLSTMPDAFGFEHVSTVLDPLLDAAGVERAPVAAFSGGAPYALAAAVAMPDRVRSVALVSGAPPPNCEVSQPRLHRLLSWLAVRVPSVVDVGYRFQRALVARRGGSGLVDLYTASGSPVTVPGGVVATLAADFETAFAETRAGAVRDHRLFGGTTGPDLDAIECPVRLWHGTADDLVPIAGARSVAEAVPGASLREFAGHGHLGTLLAARGGVIRQS